MLRAKKKPINFAFTILLSLDVFETVSDKFPINLHKEKFTTITRARFHDLIIIRILKTVTASSISRYYFKYYRCIEDSTSRHTQVAVQFFNLKKI